MTTVDSSLPLSTAQTDVWYDEQLSGGGLAYAMADYLDVRGPLDVDLFRVAARRLADEAECFRARFYEVDGEPRQVIEPLDELPVRFPDLSAAPDPESAALEWMHEDLRIPFQVTDFPLFRGALIKVGPDRHFWYLTTHHLVGDGFSAALCHRRLGEIYNALLAGRPVEDTALLPFRLLVEADLAYHESPHLQRDKEFWGKHFSSLPDLVSLSGKEPAPARGFLRRSLMLSAGTAKAVRAAAARAKVTLPTFVIAAMAAYTQRVSGINELLLTVPVAARAGVKSRAIPGMVANYLPLRMLVEPTMTPTELLSQASRELAGTLKHQRYHVNQIRRDIGVRSDERRPFGGPFVNVLPPDPELRLGPCATRLNNLSTGITNDLSVTVLDAPGGEIEMHLNGNPDLYDGDGVRRHLDRLAAFLEKFALAEPDSFLGRIEVVGPEELTELLELGTGATGPVGEGVVERVRSFALADPEAVAVIDDADVVSYRSLVGRASALSRRLGEPGLVGLLADPGAPFIAGVLAVLGSGGGYVPLDPTMPVARLAGLLADSGARTLIVDANHQDIAAELAGGSLEVLSLTDEEDDLDALAPVVGVAEDLAYVIFTSGSTGRPKGAMVHRRGMVNHLLAKVEDLGLSASDLLVQNAPLTFDVSVWQMLSTLVVGGRVRVVSRGTAADPDVLFGLVPGEGVTVLEVVPSLLRAALDAWDIAGGAPDLGGLRWLVVTGEALPPDLCARWFERFPGVALVNAYGPTECSDDVTHAVIRSVDGLGVRTPIGVAVRNTRLYVLGDELRPVPLGAIGELYVGGVGVGRGYVGDAGRTGVVFVADPFGGPGERMYRTGDRVVFRGDGSLEFVERRDFQVKIRGHRIELGEIESTLRGLPEIADAAVLVLSDAAGAKRLAGYMVAADGESVDAGAVRSRLQQILPDYMVPSAMIVLDTMPLTAHGKVDRDALPEPDFSTEVEGRAPRDAAETILCDVLAEVLNVPRVYIDDNFFALGGDSISSIQVVSRARKAGLSITPRDILEARTPASIAVNAVLDAEAASAGEFTAPEGPLLDLTEAELDEFAAEDVLPLSPLQKGLLFHSEFDQDGVDVYTVQAIANLEGPLDVSAVREACATLLRRHATLRAYFRYRRSTGEPLQVIAAEVDLPWTEIDLTGLSEKDRVNRLRDLVDEDRARRFDLAEPPLVRFTLIKLTPGRFQFLWTAHHIATDGWSVPILIRELSVLYADGGRGDSLPAVTPFRNYLAWLAQQDDHQARLAWRELLSGITEPTRIAPVTGEHAVTLPESVEVVLSEERTARLSAWVRGRDLTANTLVQACWAILIGRLAGQRDVLFGSVTSGRPADLPGVESMVGMFINTVPVRATLDPSRTLAELLTALQSQQSKMLSYHHIGLADVQNDVPGLAGIGELFDTAVVFENVPADDDGPLVTLGENVSVLDAVTLDSRHYPLSLVVEPGRRLLFRFDYMASLFSRDEVTLITERFTALLDTVLADPDRRLGRVDVVGAQEWAGLLELGTGTTGPIGEGVVERVRSFAEATPDAVAVIDDAGTVTYSSLVRRASALSRRLGEPGMVGLLADPGAPFIAGVLAALNFGGAYVPLDPTMPVARLAGLLADSGARTLVVGPNYRKLGAAVVAAAGDVDVVVLDEAEDSAELAPVVGVAEDLAYVIFTSGSTGRPKGAMVHRRGMVNHLLAKVEDLGLSASDLLVQNAPLTFDVSVWQMLSTLVVGGRVRVVSRGTAADPDVLFGLVPGEGVTVLEVVPSLLRAALDAWDIAGGAPDLGGLRWLVVTGEALPPDLCARWFERFPGVALVNAYGPTECSDDVTHAVIRSVDGLGIRTPIGVAVRNTRLYVLGDELRPVPLGAMGELYVGGVGVGRGYVGDAGRTGVVFVADPFGGPGERMYRTGDRVVFRGDGSLEFVERRDFQVKIRGHRIELGEIETTLAEHPAVTEAVVAVVGKEKNDQRLVAYVTTSEEVQTADLREHLGGKLPAYMVPATVTVLDSLPLTAHGKVDRKALPAPDVDSTSTVRAPRNPVEEILCGIYADVLGAPEVGIDEDFFDLGGHSLMATAVVSRARSALDVELSVRELFEARTVAKLAERLGLADQARPSFREIERPEVLPLSFAQLRMWFLNRLEGQDGSYNISLAVRLSGRFDREALATALEDVVRRHEILRTVFPDIDGAPYQQILPVAPHRLDPVEVDEDELAATLTADSSRGFDLAVDVPFRAKLYAVDAEHVLLLVIHHIAGDGWSVDPLANDLATAYQSRVEGRPPSWDALPAQYASFALWQRELLGDQHDPASVLSRQLAYWKEALHGLPDELELPTDRSRRAAGAYQGGTVEFDVPAEVHSGLVDIARGRGASVFMVAQAALATLLTKLGAGHDIPVGSLVAGRTDEEVHDLVGFFVNTLVLRTDTSGDPSFTELVDRVRDTDLAAYANQDLPFEHLLEAIQPARSLSRQPLFQVMLSYYEVPESGFALGGLQVRPELLAATNAKFKFDLTFQLGEHRATGGLEGTIEYSADLFTEATAQRLAEQFGRVLAAVAADPDRPLSDVPVLTDSERKQILEVWSASPAGSPDAGDGLAKQVADLRRRVNFVATDRILVTSPYQRLWPSADVVSARADDLTALAEAIRSADPAILHTTPRVLQALRARHGDVLAGRVLVSSGEVLTRSLAARLRESSHKLVDLEERPLGADRVYVLDDSLQPVPPGVRGDLYVDDQIRTGLLARWSSDGVLEVLGHSDDDVRIREIETVLDAHPEVACAAVVRADDRLIAYLVAEPGLDTTVLRAELATELPDYLVPSVFVELDGLPLTANGMLDKAALPIPAAHSRHEAETAAEEILREAFMQTLGLPAVDVDASFFELGGNSLQSVQLVARARKAGLRLTVADVLVHSTIEHLAVVADGNAGLREGQFPEAMLDPFAEVLPIRPTGDRPPLFCVHAGLGLSLPYLGLATHIDDDVPIYGLQSPNIGGDRPFPDSVESVAAEYLGRIKRIQPTGPYHLLGWSFGGLLAHEIAVRLQAAGDQVALLTIVDSYPVVDADEAVPTDQELLTSFLKHVGFDGGEFEGSALTAADVVEVLRRGDSRLADIGVERMSKVLAVMSNNARLAHQYRPARFAGDILLFISTPGLSEDEIAGRPSLWAPHVEGTVEGHGIAFGHEYLMHPQPQGQIGAAVAERLASTEGKS